MTLYSDNVSCYHLIAGVSSIASTVARLRQGKRPIEPDPKLSHAANLIYTMTGRRPTPVEERIVNIALILHADHGMNASTFAAMVVASTLSDIYLSTGSGIAALQGPLHGGANEQVLYMLKEIGEKENVKKWFKEESEFQNRGGPQKVGKIIKEFVNPDQRNWAKQIMEKISR